MGACPPSSDAAFEADGFDALRDALASAQASAKGLRRPPSKGVIGAIAAVLLLAACAAWVFLIPRSFTGSVRFYAAYDSADRIELTFSGDRVELDCQGVRYEGTITDENDSTIEGSRVYLVEDVSSSHAASAHPVSLRIAIPLGAQHGDVSGTWEVSILSEEGELSVYEVHGCVFQADGSCEMARYGNRTSLSDLTGLYRPLIMDPSDTDENWTAMALAQWSRDGDGTVRISPDSAATAPTESYDARAEAFGGLYLFELQPSLLPW